MVNISHSLGFEWCREHRVYDGCIKACGCGGMCVTHKDGQRRVLVSPDPKAGHAWAKLPLPEGSTKAYAFRCSCTCHTRIARNLSCRDWCCRRTVKEEGKACLCLCHTEAEISCYNGAFTVRCCDAACTEGETDEELLAFEPLVWPYTSTLSIRRMNKVSMTETMHLSMTVEGKPEAVDLFHLILWEVDHDYPRKPLAKRGDTLEVCKKCTGLVWPNCVLEPGDIAKAAKDASEASGSRVEVKVHAMREARKCKGEVEKVKI